MFVELGESLFPEAASESHQLRAYVERLLSAHHCGNIILLPSRRHILSFKSLGLGYFSNTVLTYISNRLQEYVAASRLASRILVVHHPSKEANWRFGDAGKIHVSMNVLNSERLHSKAFFLGEHVTDVKLISALADIYLRSLSYPSLFINFRSAMGGGSALAEALAVEEPSPHKGLVVVDRDVATSVPPFRLGTTGRTAFDRATAMNLCDASVGWSKVTPMFAFLATWGRMLENYVGPHLLSAYFDSHNRGLELRLASEAFPNFPNLSEIEMEFWRSINLKDGSNDREMRESVDAVNALFGDIPPNMASRLHAISKLKVPGDVLEWVTENYSVSRHTSNIRRAMNSDIKNDSYKAGLETLANNLLTVAAGDRSALRL